MNDNKSTTKKNNAIAKALKLPRGAEFHRCALQVKRLLDSVKDDVILIPKSISYTHRVIVVARFIGCFGSV